MVSCESFSDTVEGPVSEWSDDIYFGDDEDQDEPGVKVDGDLTLENSSSRSETNKSTFSQSRAETKRVRLKYPYPSAFSFTNKNLKHDPTVESIIQSRKSDVIENTYTRLAKAASQQSRTNSIKSRHTTGKSEIPSNSIKLPIRWASQFDNDKWDDGSNGDVDQENEILKNKTNLQAYEEACKRLKVSVCSLIVRSLNTTKINLENYGLGSKGSAALTVALIRNTTVLSINLSGNNIGHTGMLHIYQLLTENTFIEEYDLSNNSLGSEGIRKLATASISCIQLKKLSVAGNGLLASDINILLTKLEDHPNLRDLNLSHNQLNEEGGVIVAKWLCDNHVLLHLNISWCSIRLMGTRALAKAIGDNNKLTSLNLSNNSFTNDIIGYLTKSLTRNMVLNDLNLSGNQFICRYNTRIKENPSILIHGKDALVYKLFATAMTNQVLKIFRLGKNHLDAYCIMIILEAVSKLTHISLEELDLTGLTLNPKQISDKEKLFTKHHPFRCYVEPIGKTIEQCANNLLNTIHIYCRENKISLVDIFTPDESDDEWITYDQFRDGLRKVKIPFSVAQIENIMAYLGRDYDQGKLLLSSLESR